MNFSFRSFLVCITTSISCFLCFVPQAGYTQQSSTVLKVGVHPFIPPFCFTALKDGVAGIRGYSVDEFVMLGKAMDQKLRFIPIDDVQDAREKLQNGKIDILAMGTAEQARSMGASFIPLGEIFQCRIYAHEMSQSVTCLRDIAHKRIVMVQNGLYSPELVVSGDVRYVSTAIEALELLNDGEVDVFIAPSERIADYIIDSKEMRNVTKKGVPLAKTPVGLLVDAKNRVLVEELHKSIAYLENSGHVTTLREKWFGSSYVKVLGRVYGRYILFAASLSAIGILLVAMWNRTLKKRVARAIADLHRTEQQAQDIIESSPDMIFLVNEAGTIFHANERAKSNLQLHLGKGQANMAQLMANGDAEEMQAFLTKIFYDGCDKFEFAMKSFTGTPLEVEVAGRLIQRVSSTEQLACLFARNVTERNRMEEELMQSERLAIIGKMAASVAHEVNNPLSIIQANAEDLMLTENMSEDLEEGLSAIQRNAIRAGEITKGLLEVASPKPINMRSLEVSSLIADAIFLLGVKAKGRNIHVDMPESCAPIYIHGDKRTLQQVLANLLFNSLAHMPENGTLTVVVRQDSEEDGTVRIVVNDTGKGIARENLMRIFDPFFSSRKGGFGLGLFITRRMVERHNGLVFAESELGKKTSVYLEFPARVEEKKDYVR